MASLGNALVGRILGHSAAEKAFRPWWDNVEDFLVYGLVMLGLIVAPTAIINGTPLDCNFCKGKGCSRNFEKPDAPPVVEQNNPGYNIYWVKKYCTMTAVDGFILYFPYLLLIMAFVIVLVERVFLRIFRAGLKLDSFYSLLSKDTALNDAEEDHGSYSEEEDAIKNKAAIEVLHSFTSNSNYFLSYLIRTLTETVLASGLLTWLVWKGFPSIQKDEFIFCDVYGFHYECAGHPQQFYMYVLFVAVAILILFVLCCVYNITWIVFPQLGTLSQVMRRYRAELREKHDGRNDKDFLGDLHWIYFTNKDLKLLLDLLATSSGVSRSISLLTLFDPSLRIKSIPAHLNVEISDSTAIVEVGEAEAIRDLFSTMEELSCIYTVEIRPPTHSSCVRALKFDAVRKTMRKGQDIEMSAMNGKDRIHKATFSDLEENKEYHFLVCTLINGHPIAKKIITFPSKKENSINEGL